ncbi:MAG: thioredoxin family protein [Candidatus Lokiarchaeota archaeon]|nr:thioredoxin family protein [Candidatus Harpocratesius repetitus]
MAYPLILYFSSPYCAPCKNVERMLNDINVSLFGNKLRIKKVDIASDLTMAEKYKVISVPTIIIGDIRLSVIIDKNELTDAILQGFISSVSFEEEEIDPLESLDSESENN